MGTPSQANNSSVAVAAMSAFGTLGSAEWRTQLPLSIEDPTAPTELAQHDTIGPDNQYEPGAIVGVTAAPKIRVGATAEALDTFLDAGLRCAWSGPTSLRATATRPTSATTAHYVVPTMGAALRAGDLVWVSGCAIAANNGLKVVSGSPSTTTIPTTPAPLAETFTAVQNVTIEVCGYQFGSGDCTIDETSGVYTIGATTKDLTQLGLVAGQVIHIGSSDAAAYAFATAADYGPAMVTSTPVAGSFTVAPLFGQTFVDDAGTSKTIRLLFGQTARVVPKTSGNYLERFYQVETSVENLGTADATAWIYGENAAIDTLTISAPSKALVTLAVDMKATDATKEESQRTNASTPTVPKRVLPYSTATADFTGRIYLSSAGTALTGYVSSMNLVLENQASENPAIGQASSAFTSFGKVRVRLETSAFLTVGGAIDAARNNTAIKADFAMRNAECAYFFVIPDGRIQNGPATFPKNQVVALDLPIMANKDGTYSTSLIVSKIPGCPALPARTA